MLENCRTHLAQAREGYFEHLRFAATVGIMLVAAGLACLIHALLPALCERTASRTVERLSRLFADRGLWRDAKAETSGATTLAGLMLLCLPSWALVIAAPTQPFALGAAMLAAAFPVAYLWTNPQLEAVAE